MSAPAIPTAALLVYPHGPYMCVHESLRRIVGGDFATAALLQALEFRSRPVHSKGIPRFQRTCRQLSADVQECATEQTIRKKCIPKLVELEFIRITKPEGNNKFGDWFEVDVEKIQKALLGPNPGKITAVDPGKFTAPSIKSNTNLKTTTAAAFKATSSLNPEKPPADAAQKPPPEMPTEPNPETSQETESVRAELEFLEAADPEEFLAKWPLARLKDAIAYTYRAIQRGIRSGNHIDNPGGFLRDAIRKGLRIPEVVPIATPSPPSTVPPDCDKCMDTGLAGLDYCDCDRGTRAQRREELRGPIDHELHLGRMDSRQHKAELVRVFAEAGL